MTEDLGHDILRYAGSDQRTLEELLSSRHRFLDELWLPCPLSELSPEQVKVTNRFREARRDADPQFFHAGLARKAAGTFCVAVKCDAVLEIGCGKFPLASKLWPARYFGIEIDGEAAAYCNALGLDVTSLAAAMTSYRRETSEVVVAIYSLHFALEEALWSFLEENIQKNALLFCALIIDDVDHFSRVLARLRALWPDLRVLKSARMSRREVILVGGRGRVQAKLASGWAAVNAALTEE